LTLVTPLFYTANRAERSPSETNKEERPLKETYELLFGYVHCRGKTTYSAGYANSQEEALSWVLRHREGQCPPPRVPPDDPLRTCRASFCPLKRQKPWFDMAPRS